MKKWYESKTILGIILTAITTAYGQLQPIFGWPVIPNDWLLALQALGLVVAAKGRFVADGPLEKL
jgi:hypothetical protein